MHESPLMAYGALTGRHVSVVSVTPRRPVGFRSTRPWPSATAARRHDEVRALVEGEVATDGLPILDWSYEHVTQLDVEVR
jgi:hypothetical protein